MAPTSWLQLQGAIGQGVHRRAVVMGRGAHQGAAQQEDAAHVLHLLRKRGNKNVGKMVMKPTQIVWLVVWTPLKNISQLG